MHTKQSDPYLQPGERLWKGLLVFTRKKPFKHLQGLPWQTDSFETATV